MILSIVLCLMAYAATLAILRRDGTSLGLPFAYMSLLLLIHVPGAFAHAVANGTMDGDEFTAIGIEYTAIGAIAFAVGVAIAHFSVRSKPANAIHERKFRLFCIFAGFTVIFATSRLHDIPSLGAVIDRSSVVWVLGVLLSLKEAVRERNYLRLAVWSGLPVVFAFFQLYTTGFLSYGTANTIIAMSVLAISARNVWRVAASVAIIAVVGLNVFVNYFENRDDIRGSIGRPVPIERYIHNRELHIFDIDDPDDLSALDQRLNQNLFVGLSAVRIDLGAAEFLNGRSVIEGLISLIPRAVWPDKPVYGGSPEIITEMTGLPVPPDTSFGVGNVMEFYINFGVPSLIAGFLILGWGLATLDLKAADAARQGQFGRTLMFFLPAVALIQPNGSIVELAGGAAAAIVASYAWRSAWLWLSGRAVQPDVENTTISTFRR